LDNNNSFRSFPKLSESEILESLKKEISDEELDDIINGLQTLSILVFEVLKNTKK
jgi:hypothetical protein